MMENLFRLDGKVAVVTGGNRGLGEQISLGLASFGADVVIVQRNHVEPAVCKTIRDMGRKCCFLSHDLTEPNKADELIRQIVNEWGHIDILVNNAGVQKRNDSVAFTEEDWDFVQNVNAKSVFFLCQEAGKYMIKQGAGKIINMASLLSFQGGYRVPAYAASKAAVAAFTKSLANEWASKGINVNAVAPGYMATEMNTQLLEDQNRNRQILDRIPAGRWGNPEDIVGAVIYLASAASSYVNGETITVDGGWMGR